ncbi:MAG TPA: VanW family protein [Dehalococcoidia bacterium]|nr:VanW family protein [Dehalococcoidia bacterium]
MSYIAPSREQPRPSWPPLTPRLVALGACLGILATLVFIVGMLLVWQMYYRDTIYPHVTANGIDVGGLTSGAARERLESHFRVYAEQPLTLRAEGATWVFTPAQLGLRTDMSSLAAEAFEVGRDGSPIERLLTPVRLRNGTTVQARPTLAVDVREAALTQLAADIDRPAVDARIEIAAHGVTVSDDVTGRRLDREQTARRLAAALEELRREPIDLVVEPVPPTATAAALRPVAARAQTVLDRPASLSYGDRSFPIDQATVREALRLSGHGANTQIGLDPAVLRGAVAALEPEVDRPVRSASLQIEDARPVFDTGHVGITLQVGETVAALREAILSGDSRAALVVSEVPQPVEAASFEAARRDLETILSGPIVVRAIGRDWSVGPAELAPLVSVIEPTGNEPAAIAFEAGATKLVKAWAADINRSSVSPLVSWNGGNLQVIREGRKGHELQVEKAVVAFQQAARSDSRTVDLPVVSWGTDVTQANVASLGIRELVADASTPYAGSIPERAHNVELAAKKINGTLIAPGEKFSFNRAIGPTTTDAGFKVAFGIATTGNGPKTVPSVAGGICQVATTLFQPVFWAGYQIDERMPHSYWIPKYASKGLPGLDTTVDEPSGLDFRFTNNSPHHLLIQSWTADEKLHFALYGTKTGWDVKVREPAISNRVKADTTTVREPSDWLPAGETLATEHAEDGFSVTVTRTVTDQNGKARQDSFTSHYQPSRNVVLVGTGQNGGRRAQGN